MTSPYCGNRTCMWLQAMYMKHIVFCTFSYKYMYMHVRYSEYSTYSRVHTVHVHRVQYLQYSTYSACTGFPHYSTLHLCCFATVLLPTEFFALHRNIMWLKWFLNACVCVTATAVHYLMAGQSRSALAVH
jgi:hypothetical protein